MTKLQAIQSSIANADSWSQKGQPAWVCKCLSSALMNYLSIAVEDYPDSESGSAWLVDNSVDALLLRHLNALTDVRADVDKGAVPESVLGGNYHHLVFAHLGWLLGDFDTADKFIRIADRVGVREISTPFWQEYCNALVSLRNGIAYELLVPPSLKDLENYWAEYLRFIAKVTHGKTLSSAATQLDESFAKRNADKSIKDDQYETEGSGRHPVKWDFRRESLFQLENQKSGQTF